VLKQTLKPSFLSLKLLLRLQWLSFMVESLSSLLWWLVQVRFWEKMLQLA